MTDPAVNSTARRPGLLVVEEERGVRLLLELALNRQGFQIFAADNGVEAVDLYKSQASDIDLVLMDVRMEGLSSPDTLSKLREINPAVRCCLMTGDTALTKAEERFGQDVLHVFRKPFLSLVEFGNQLRQFLKP
jgi:two-component system cell cycle sensor histidine kinase/response regulator CckA